MSDALLPVIQADRDAAGALVQWQRDATDKWKQDQESMVQFFVGGFVEGIIEGRWDNHAIVQAMAKHRLAHSPEPAGDGELRHKLCILIEDKCPAIDPETNIALGSQVEALADAIIALRSTPPDGWRTIESAPRDRPVLLLSVTEMAVCSWMTSIEDGSSDWIMARGDADGVQIAFRFRDPSHWRPLPAPPQAAQGDGL